MARRDARWDVLLLALCHCLGMGALFSSVSVVALVMRERAGAGLALLPMALQKLVQTAAVYPCARHRNRRGYLAASLVGSTGYAVAAVGVSLVDGGYAASTSAAVVCVGYCVSGLSDPFTQFLRFTAGEISPPGFRARAISYVVAGGALAAVIGPELSNTMVDAVPGSKYAGSYAGAAALLLLQGAVVTAVDFSPPDDGDGASAGEGMGAGADAGGSPVPLGALSQSLESGGSRGGSSGGSSGDAGSGGAGRGDAEGGCGGDQEGLEAKSAAEARVQPPPPPLPPDAAPAPRAARTLWQMIAEPQFGTLASTAAVLQLTMISLMQICPLVMTETRDGGGAPVFELWHAVRVIQVPSSTRDCLQL